MEGSAKHLQQRMPAALSALSRPTTSCSRRGWVAVSPGGVAALPRVRRGTASLVVREAMAAQEGVLGDETAERHHSEA